jgi:hypothetical protein
VTDTSNIPLAVDLDGTLIRTDMTFESLARLFGLAAEGEVGRTKTGIGNGIRFENGSTDRGLSWDLR